MRAQIVRQLLPWLQRAFVLLAVLFIVLLLRSHWQQLRAYSWRILPTWFAVATVLLAITWLVEVEIWRRILGQMGGRVPLTEALRIWFLSAAVRYVPGNIWQTISLALYCRRWQVRAETAIASLVVYQVVVLIATLPVAVAYILFGRPDMVASTIGFPLTLTMRIIITLATVVCIVMLMSHGRLLFNLVDWVLTRMHRPPLEIDLRVSFLSTVLMMGLVDWLLWGCTFAAFAYALGTIAPDQRLSLLPDLVTSYPLAYVAGFISFLTPSGLGVREGAFLFLLTPKLDAAVVVVIAIGMRAWTTAGELFAAGIAALTGPVGEAIYLQDGAPVTGATTMDEPLKANGTRQTP